MPHYSSEWLFYLFNLTLIFVGIFALRGVLGIAVYNAYILVLTSIHVFTKFCDNILSFSLNVWNEEIFNSTLGIYFDLSYSQL